MANCTCKRLLLCLAARRKLEHWAVDEAGGSQLVSTSLNINDLEIVVFDVFVVLHNIDHVDPFASFDLSVAGAANVSLMDAVMNQ